MSPIEDRPETAPGGGATLRHGHASMRAVTTLGLAAMQIGPGVALAGGYLLLYAGNASWLAMTLALLAAAALGLSVATFSRRMVATGGLISYVGSSLGRSGRALTAAGYLSGVLISVAATVTGVVVFTSSFLAQAGWHWATSGPAQALSAVLLTVAAAGLTYMGLDTSVKVSAVLAFAPIPFVLWVTIAASAVTGLDLGSQFDFSAPEFSVSLLVPAVIIASANFVGFEGVSAFAGETENPRRNVPRLLGLLVGICGVSYVAIIFFQVPSLNEDLTSLTEGESPTAVLAHVGNVGYLAAPLDLLLAGATFAGLVGVMNYGSRIVATAAADGLIPRKLAKIHAVRRSPVNAIAFMAVLAAGVPVLLQVVSSSPPLESSVYLYTFYAYFYLVPYALAAVAAIVLLLREGRANPLRVIIIAAGGLAWSFVLLYQLVNPSGGIFTALPWMALGLTAGVYAIFVVAHRRNPAAEATIEELL